MNIYNVLVDAAVLGTDFRRSPKSLSSAQAASLCSAGIERARSCLEGKHFVRCCAHSLLFRVFGGRRGGGSAAVCDPNPPRPFARYRAQGSDLTWWEDLGQKS